MDGGGKLNEQYSSSKEKKKEKISIIIQGRYMYRKKRNDGAEKESGTHRVIEIQYNGRSSRVRICRKLV